MVIIRLSRSGSKQKPYYNVVVQDSRKRRDGRFIERVGFYNPMAQSGSETIRLNEERIAYWKGHEAKKAKKEAEKAASAEPVAEEAAAPAEEAAAPAEEAAAPAEEAAAPAEEAAAPAEEAPKED